MKDWPKLFKAVLGYSRVVRGAVPLIGALCLESETAEDVHADLYFRDLDTGVADHDLV